MGYKKITKEGSLIKKYLLLSILFITSCQSLLPTKQVNVLFNGQSISFIEITHTLRVFPGSARAFLQRGQQISISQLDLYDTNCEVEINTVLDEQYQEIKAEKFNIVSIAWDESPIVMLKPLVFASTTLAWSSDSPVDIKRYYYFKLTAQNPESLSQVRALICRGVQDTPYNAQLPTFEEIKNATGQFIKFKG
jgi:hypothetical protein